jgi:hypothetical protein
MKGIREEAGLLTHACGAPIRIVVAVERIANQLLEPRDGLRLTSELIVEPQHLGNEAGTKLERERRAGVRNRACGRLGDDIALDGCQPPWRVGQTAVQFVIQLVARDTRRANTSVCRYTFELSSGRAIRHDDVRAIVRPNLRARPDASDIDNRAKVFVQVSDANQPRPTRCDHRSCGRLT